MHEVQDWPTFFGVSASRKKGVRPSRGPLASAATTTRTACGKSARVRLLGLPPARRLRLLAAPILPCLRAAWLEA